MPKSRNTYLLLFFYLLLAAFSLQLLYTVCTEDCGAPLTASQVTLPQLEYHETHSAILATLQARITAQPFNLIALIIFLLAVTHTFFARKLTQFAHYLEGNNIASGKAPYSFAVEFFKFMGEVEVIFGIWVVPLLVAMSYYYDWQTSVYYLETRRFTEPLFVLVIMTMTSTRPILNFFENIISFVSRLMGGSLGSFWITVLTLGPIFGSFITEPGAMTVCALLLSKRFYNFKPSLAFSYATLGLLFTNISVGGVFTNFAAPPVLMVAQKWHWDISYMFTTFGLKALLGIIIANATYFIFFKNELKKLEKTRKVADLDALQKLEKPETTLIAPLWLTCIQLFFLAWTVIHVQHPVIFIGGFLIFLGFYQATLPFQDKLELKNPILVSLFLSGLVIHGSLQGWWIGPILGNLPEELLIISSTILTAFNDNAEITFLASLIPDFSDSAKYAVMAGAVTGGGLTVIANAPNPLGQSVLAQHFSEGISPLYLFLGALVPTLIIGSSFWFLA